MYIQVQYLAGTFTSTNVSQMQKEKVHQTTSRFYMNDILQTDVIT